MAVAPHKLGPTTVFVHLSQVPEEIRLRVAEREIRVYKLSGPEAIELKMAALLPRQDPEIEVEFAKAKKVLGFAAMKEILR